MSSANLREVKDEQTTQDRARAAIRTHRAEPDEPIGTISESVSPRRRLDVDAVLRRSLPRLTAKES